MAGRPGRGGAERRHSAYRLCQRHLEGAADSVFRPCAGRQLGAPAEPSLRRTGTVGADERRRCDRSRGGPAVSRCRARAVVLSPPLTRVNWASATRIVASKYPPIDLYERVSPDPAIWDALIAAEM